MKQIKINSNCDGCGICVVKLGKYIEENDEGNAQPITGVFIKSEDIGEIDTMICECPTNSISIVDSGVTGKVGVEGVKEVIFDLKKKCKEFKVDKPNSSDYRFDVRKYHQDIPYSNKMYDYDYSSERSAKSAAEDEFRRLCYSENACRPIVKKIFVEYKVDKLKKFYDYENEEDNYYYKYNEKIRHYLADAYAEICSLVGENVISEDWKQFSVYLTDKNCYYIEFLKDYDENSKDCDIIEKIEDFSKDSDFRGIKSYLLDFEYDSTEEIVGTGLFGKTKYKEKWCFYGFREAAREFMEDVYYHMDMDDDIMDRAGDYISSACEEFESVVKEKFNEKIDELIKILKLDLDNDLKPKSVGGIISSIGTVARFSEN